MDDTPQVRGSMAIKYSEYRGGKLNELVPVTLIELTHSRVSSVQ